MKNIYLIIIIITNLSCQDKLNIEPNYFSVPYYEASFELNGVVSSGSNENRKLLFQAYQNRDNSVKKDSFTIQYSNIPETSNLYLSISNIPLSIGKYKILPFEYINGFPSINSNRTIGGLGEFSDTPGFKCEVDSTSNNNLIEVTRYDTTEGIIEGKFNVIFKLTYKEQELKIDSTLSVRNGVFKAKIL